MQLTSSANTKLRAAALILSIVTICFFNANLVSATSGSFGNPSSNTGNPMVWANTLGQTVYLFNGGDGMGAYGISAYLRCASGTTTVNVSFAIYDAVGQNPPANANLTLLAQTPYQTFSMTTSPVWCAINFSSQLALTNNHYYVIAINYLGAAATWCYATGTTYHTLSPALTFGSAFPNPEKITFNNNDVGLQAFANYTDLPITNYTLTVNTPANGAINQSSGSFNNDTFIGLLATPNNNYAFLNWAIDGSNSTSNPTNVTMTANHTVSAYFSEIDYALTVNNPTHGSINTTSGSYINGSVVYLLETPDPNYHFLNWVIDGSNYTSPNPITVTMTANHTVSAYFELSTWYLDVGAEFHGTMNTSSGWHDDDEIVNILATPDPHYAFLNWIIDGSNETDNPLEITMDQNHTVDAYFDISEYYLTISAMSHGSINTTSGYYPVGEMVFIEGYGAAHYALEYFNVDGTNQSWLDWDINVTMDSDHTVGAYFIMILRGVTAYDPIGGTTNATNSTYDDGTTITLVATPSANYTFSHWYTDYYPNSTDNPYDLLVESNIDLYAYFDPYSVIPMGLEITPTNTTYYTNVTLDFDALLTYGYGTPASAPYENGYIVVSLNTTFIYLDQSNSSGLMSGSYNLSGVSPGNYTLTAQFNEYVNGTSGEILSGNTTAAQLIEILAIPAAPAPAAPAPAPVKHTNSVGQLGTVVIILAAIIIYSASKGKNGRHPIKIRG